jgi:hypothetical protein
VQLLLRYIEDEFQALHRHASIFRTLCGVPFETLERKPIGVSRSPRQGRSGPEDRGLR